MSHSGDAQAWTTITFPKVVALRAAIATSTNLEALINTALTTIYDLVPYQTVSIYLLNKNGILTRAGLVGRDRNGQQIRPDWFSCEAYRPGEGFSAGVIQPTPGSKYGSPAWSTDPDTLARNEASYQRYVAKLGDIRSILATPLNGSTQTFGALELINKLTPDRKLVTQPVIAPEEVDWASVLALVVASAITTLRSRMEANLLAEVSRILASAKKPFATDHSARRYRRILGRLVNPLSPFKAAVLRVRQSTGSLDVAAKAADGVTWHLWKNIPIVDGQYLAGVVAETQRQKIVRDVTSTRYSHLFANMRWLKRNAITSCACFPLISSGALVGTLSLYNGFKFQYIPSDIAVITTIASVIAFFADKDLLAAQLRATTASLQDYRLSRISAAHEATYQAARDEGRAYFYHRFSKTLDGINKQINVLLSAAPPEVVQSEAATRLRSFVAREYQLAQKETDPEGRRYSRLHLNEIIRDVVGYRNLELPDRKISFQVRCSPNIPPLLMSTADVIEILDNLLANAVEAVERNPDRTGTITVETKMRLHEGQEDIVLTVADSGIGIKSDQKEDIFSPSYSTRRTTGGRGLGLYITKQIIKHYVGQIRVRPNQPRGARFIITLPLNTVKA